MTTTLGPARRRQRPVTTRDDRAHVTLRELAPYAIAGVILGIILIKSEVVYWSRIQEMFRFQSFHMYGVVTQ